MGRGERFFHLLLGGFALTGAVILAGVGGSRMATGRDATGYFIAAAWVFGSALWILLLIDVVWPSVLSLSRFRARRMAALAVPLPAQPVAPAVAAAPAGPIQTPPADVPLVGFAVLHAWYGSGETWLDVTEQTRAQVLGGRLEMTPSNALFGDPTPNVFKSLIVEFALNGIVDRRTVAEGAPFALP